MDTDFSEQLKAAFPFEQINWLPKNQFERNKIKYAMIFPYLNKTAIQDRLDATVGIANWKNEYVAWNENSVLCGLSIKLGNEWVIKWDGAENTQFEKIKGGFSDSFKRAAYMFGIGRYLKEFKPFAVEVEGEEKRIRIKKSEFGKIEIFYRQEVSRLFPGNSKIPVNTSKSKDTELTEKTEATDRGVDDSTNNSISNPAPKNAIEILHSRASSADISEKDICERFIVNSIYELTIDQVNSAMKLIAEKRRKIS